MFKSQILKIYREYVSPRMRIGKEREKEYDEMVKCEVAMVDKIGDDEELKKIFTQYDHALNNLNSADAEDIYKAGFILGARIALEICGVERKG